MFAMTTPADINRPIVEALYAEALLLADDVRFAFDLARTGPASDDGDLARIALSVEGLRTTTRVMHVLAWLLNQRAYFNGEMSEFQLLRHGKLREDRPSDPDNLALIAADTCSLVRHSERLHRRIARLDAAWRSRFEAEPGAVTRMRDRLGRAIEGG